MLCRIAVWSSVVALGTLVSAQAVVFSGSSHSESSGAAWLGARLFPEASFEVIPPGANPANGRPGWDIAFELGHSSGSVNPGDAFYNDPPRSGLPVFVPYDPHHGSAATNDPSRSEWEYLWRDPSCVPIHAIPEPTTAVLIGVSALLLLHRKRR